MTLQQERKPVSECIKRCKLEDTKSFCTGCNRTLKEIIDKGKNK